MAVATAEKKTTEAPRAAESKGAVAVFSPPRLPWAPAIEERFGVDKSSWKALVEAVYPLAQSVDSVILALSYCKARRLDPFKRPVHIVPIYDKEKRRLVDTIWPGIAEHRTTAFRTKQYAGADPTAFGPSITRTFTGDGREGQMKAEVTFPEWAQMTLYRMVDGQRVPIPGPRVYWLETYSRIGRTDVPNDMWQKRASGQLEKCAEAAALRKAFPEEIGDELTADEAGTLITGEMRDVTPKQPERKDFKPETAEAQPDQPAAYGFDVVSADGEILWAGEDETEFGKRLMAELDAVKADPARLSGTWETNEPHLAHCSEVCADTIKKVYAGLTAKPAGKLV